MKKYIGKLPKCVKRPDQKTQDIHVYILVPDVAIMKAPSERRKADLTAQSWYKSVFKQPSKINYVDLALDIGLPIEGGII